MSKTESAVSATYFSIIGNTVLAIAKALAGIFGNSYALIADAIESTADIFASLLVLFGLKYAERPADDNHPYGHGKIEPLITFMVVAFLVTAGLLIFVVPQFESLFEGFGFPIIEAMACGTPAIVRDAGGCAEIIETTNAGFVYRQSSELPALLHRIVREPGLRQRLSELALSGTRKFYTRQRYMDDYLALIDELHGCRQATGDRHLTTPEGQNQ